MRLARPQVVATGLIGLVVTVLAAQASAQQVYRIVGPDGRVTFSDQPPLDPRARAAPAGGSSNSAGGASSAGLPFELQQVASKYPVTLYTSAGCNACGSGRAYLTSRGIPFNEKTISTPEDAQALQRMAGESMVPLLTVGGQQIRGYSDSEWGQFLDAAGYPSRSVLPSSWRNPAPSPLVALQRALPAAETARRNNPPAPVVEAPSATPPEAPADNPAGIKF